jgi:hypothetical protein
MGYSKDDLALDPLVWTDIAAVDGYEDVAGQLLTIQSKGNYPALVYIGGALPPSGDSLDHGISLNPGSAVTITADNFWVKGQGSVAILIED